MTSGTEWTEAKFEALTLHSNDIISLLDASGRLLFNSPATVRINGFTPDELRERDTFELIHPDDRARVGQVFSEVLSTPGALCTVEYRYLAKDGRWLWMEAIASNQLDNPAVRGVVANSRDISERKRAEAERLRLEQQVLHVQKLESLGVMAGGVAHDFNNLLAVILGEVSLLLDEPGTDRARGGLERIELAAQNAAELTRQLLTYAGTRTPALQPTDLRALVNEVTPLLHASARGDVRLVLDLADEVPWVSCDPGQIRQVLLNLVINASESISGTGQVTVRLGARTVSNDDRIGPFMAGFEPGRAVMLEVADTGAGIAPEVMSRIFDPFYTTKQTGRGLGLAAVAGIVAKHAAGLQLESTLGAGTVFRLLFHPSEPGVTPTPPPVSARFAGRVLVVDDDVLVARTLAGMLTRLGFACTIADSGSSAVDQFGSDPSKWSLVVCDVLMPGMSGPDAVARMRRARVDVPVLFVSGFTADHQRLTLEPHTGFLGKPFNTAGLARAVHQLVPAAAIEASPRA